MTISDFTMRNRRNSVIDERRSKVLGLFLGLVALGIGDSFASSNDEVLVETLRQIETGLRPAIRPVDAATEHWTIIERMRHYSVPAVSLAIVHDGKLALAKAYGEVQSGFGEPVTTDTVFSVGSLSKVGAAMVVLRLVADGAVDLDADVAKAIKRWRVPNSPIRVREGMHVTLRGLLSHTAGLSVHGFADFQPSEDIPSVVEILEGAAPAKNAPVQLIYPPGASSAYSGGGTTVVELLVEEITKLEFPDAAEENVFAPLEMARTTYRNPLPASHGNIARAHDEDGKLAAKPRGWHTFAERAASGLWTTPSDYARMVVALMDSYHGTGGFLPQSIAIDALTEVGASPYGLGPELDGFGLNRRFMHGGSNESYKAFFEVYIERGEGLIVFTNGANGDAIYAEIRRAAASAFGWPDNQEVLTIDTDKVGENLGRFVGTYVAAKPTYLAGQRALISEPLEYRVEFDESGLSLVAVYVADGDRTYEWQTQLYPVAPQIFTDIDATVVVEFVRNTFNESAGFVLSKGAYSAGFIPVDN